MISKTQITQIFAESICDHPRDLRFMLFAFPLPIPAPFVASHP
jgi:hypothetical protein